MMWIHQRWHLKLPRRWPLKSYRRWGAVLLEPMMTVEVVTPEENMGDVVGDLNRRRGIIHGMDENPSGKVVNAECLWLRCLAMPLICDQRSGSSHFY